MKKLGKLTLKEMSHEMAVISPSNLPELIGGSIPPSGFNSAQDVWNFCWGEVADELSPITNAISDAFETMADAKNDFVNWVEDNRILQGIGAGAVALADLLLTWYTHLPTTGGMPIYPSQSEFNPSFSL